MPPDCLHPNGHPYGTTRGRRGFEIRGPVVEEGVDVVMYRHFADGRVGIPLYLMQCASGSEKEKLKTPDIDTWRKIIVFASAPKRAYATPYALLQADFIRKCGRVDGLFLDRSRISVHDWSEAEWLPRTLASRLVQWSEPRIESLPSFD